MSEINQNDRFLTTAEVAELLRTVPATVRYWRHIGKGPKGFKVGVRVLYAREDVHRRTAGGPVNKCVDHPDYREEWRP